MTCQAGGRHIYNYVPNPRQFPQVLHRHVSNFFKHHGDEEGYAMRHYQRRPTPRSHRSEFGTRFIAAATRRNSGYESSYSVRSLISLARLTAVITTSRWRRKSARSMIRLRV